MHILDVYLRECRVGAITNLDNDHNVFVFDPAYVEDAEREVLSLGFYNAAGEFAPPAPVPQLRLPPFFANLLPEGHLREYVARRARVNAKRDFPILWLTGEDLPGAVRALPRDGARLASDDPVIAESIQDDPGLMKFSLAGVQLKFSALLETDGGLTIPLHGQGGQWIVKMPSALYPYVPQNEFSMLAFARRVGIDVPEFGMIALDRLNDVPRDIRTDLGDAMYIRRFDRTGDRAVHMEDFAQIFNHYPDAKYKNVSYANMLAGIWRVMGEEQAKEFVRRLVFNVAIGNGDMHLKNWSVVYRDGKHPRLSPAYDYVSTIAYLPDDDMALTIARSRRWEDVDDTLLERFARRAGVPRGLVLRAAREMVERINAESRHINDAGLLPSRMLHDIERHMARVPLMNQRRSHAAS